MDHFELNNLNCNRIKVLKASLLEARDILKIMYPDIEDMEEDLETSKLVQSLITTFNQELNENSKQKRHLTDLLNLS
jgi:hypothetical protein